MPDASVDTQVETAAELSDDQALPLPEASENSLLGGMFVALGMAILVVLMLRMARKARRRSRVTETPAERLAEIRDTAMRDGAHEHFAARSADVARRYAALIDNKAERLEQLIAEASELAERLEALQGDAVGVGPSESTAEPVAVLPPRAVPEPEPDPLKQRVFELADAGIEPVEIARRIGTHTGKVELILALRNAAG